MLRRRQERVHRYRSHCHETNRDHKADVSPSTPRDRALRDAPLGREEPQSVGKVPRGAENSNRVKSNCPGMTEHFILDFAECRTRMRQNVYAVEAQMPCMPNDVEKGDCAGPSLGGVQPVAGPWIFGHIAFATRPDIKAIKRVVENGQPDSKQLQPEDEWETAQKCDLICVSTRPFRGEGVGNEMLDQK